MNTVTNTANTKNLVDTAAANGSFKTFGKAIERAGMSDTLRGVGPFTIFAPTDAAFDKLPSGKLDNLFKPENKEELTSLLNYHVVSGRKLVADIGKWESAKTVNGQSAPITMTKDRSASMARWSPQPTSARATASSTRSTKSIFRPSRN